MARRFLLIGVLILVVLLLGYDVREQHTLPLGVHTLHADDAALGQLNTLGAGYLVQVFVWRDIEPTQGEFHWEYTDWLVRAATYYHLKVIARLDKPPAWASSVPTGLSAPPKSVDQYAEFVGQVAARYRGQLAGYIVWNEPNLAREWGDDPPDPAAYVELLRAAAAQIRRADPAARVVSAGLAPTNEESARALDDRMYLKAMYAAGVRGAFDILAAHPYGFANAPDDPRGAHDGLNMARLQDLRDIMVANGDGDKPVWITEFGYTTTATPDTANLQVDEAQQAQYLAQAFALARERWDWVGLFTVWNLAQNTPPTDEQAGYSLMRGDGSFKPAFAAVRDLPKQSWVEELGARMASAWAAPAPAREFSVLARDVVIHLGDSDYPPPWVALYQNRNPSTEWDGEFYLNAAELEGVSRQSNWTLTLELMQVNDLVNELRVNDVLTKPRFLPAEPNFTSVWVTVQLAVPAAALHAGVNRVTLRDGKTFPAVQQKEYTWDDLQVRNMVLHAP